MPPDMIYTSRLQDQVAPASAEEMSTAESGTLRIIPVQDEDERFTQPDTGLTLVATEDAAEALAATVPNAVVTRLPEAAALALLDRIPTLVSRPPGDDIVFPRERLKPPPAGGLEILSFPPPEADVSVPEAAAADDIPMQVLRYTPTADMELVPHVSITFSRPMVDLTSHAMLAAADWPVTLSPLPSGEWYWMGTRTVVFQPESRMPGATRYRVEIPAGMEGADGTTLATDFSWEFETGRLALTQTWPPNKPQPLQPYVALEFNQAIDIQALESHISLRAAGRRIPYAVLRPDLHLLPPDLERFLARTVPERTIVLQPLQPLPPNTTLTVTVKRGAPSAEGPLVTEQTQHMSLRTFGPLQIEYTSCRNALDACTPGEGFHIEFNHELEPTSLTTEMVSIEPPLPNGTIRVYPWGGMYISGATAPNTVYKLRLTPGLQDTFGQTFTSVQEVLFHVGEQTPELHFPNPMEVLYPHNEGLYDLYSYNLKRLRVILYQVEPADWEAFLSFRDKGQVRNAVHYLDREPVLDTVLNLEASATRMTRTQLNLNPYLENGQGHLMMILVPPVSLLETLFGGHRDHIMTWLQATNLGVDAYADQDSLIVHATSLDTGAPLANVNLRLLPEDITVVTDAGGHAHFTLPEVSLGKAPRRLIAQHGQDSALLPQAMHSYRDPQWAWARDRVHHKWHVFTDRHLYQPGEEMRVKGWVRKVEFAPMGDVTWTQPRRAEINYRIYDGQRVELAQGSTKLDEYGALDLRFVLPPNVNSGLASVQFELQDRRLIEQSGWFHDVTFRIEEFRRPEFEMNLTPATGPHFLDETVHVDAHAQYFGGGPLQGAAVDWQITGESSHYAPPGWDRFNFGLVSPWWMEPWHDDYSDSADTELLGRQAALASTLDARGQHRLTVTASASRLPVPHMLHVEATVQDMSQQTFSDETFIMVHPSRLYVGGRTDSYLATADEPYALDIIVTDIDGQPVPYREIRVQARPDAEEESPQVALAESDPRLPPACLLQSAMTPVSCDLVFPEPGRWVIELTVLDESGKPNLTRLMRQVIGEGTIIRSSTPSGTVELMADRAEYQPGDVAEILIQPPFLPAYGTVITNRSGIVAREPIAITQAQHVLQVPIAESYIPNLHVTVLLVGQAARPQLDGRLLPAMAHGQLDLSVPPYTRELDLDLQMTDNDLRPGSEAAISVRVTNHAGQPVEGAEVVLLAVDEAVLALTGYQFDNPLDTFYPHRWRDLDTYRLRRYMQSQADAVLLQGVSGRGGGYDEMTASVAESLPMQNRRFSPAAAPDMMMNMAEDAADDGGGGSIPLRTDFNPLAVFEPSGTTDADGVLQVRWELPDTIGRYRVVALSTSGPHLYGLAETSYTAHLPVQLRPQWPRFLNFGDVADLSVLVENQTDEDQDLTLLVQSDGLALSYQAAALAVDALTFTLPAQSRQQILVPATARTTGESQLQVSVFNDQLGDAVQDTLPVYVPAAQEGFAAYGIVEDMLAVQGFQLPADAHANFGQLTISTSSTVLQSLLDSYLTLGDTRGWDYPERIASRLLANIALRDVLYAFQQPDLPEQDVLDDRIQLDIEDLIRFQKSDGGFALWSTRGSSWPFVSVHSMHALAIARTNGYAVPNDAIAQGLLYLSTIEQRFADHYSAHTRRYITAYALYVRMLLGDMDTLRVGQLLDSVQRASHPPEVVAWSLLVLHQDPDAQEQVAEWMEFVLNRVAETTSKASFARAATEQDDHLVLYSAHRSDALLLSALMAIQPESDLVPKVVNGLLATRTPRGHWGSAQGNVFVLQAMNQYFRLYEAMTPDFTARVWLDDTLVVNTPFQERETTVRHVSLPMAWLFAEAPDRIQIQRFGQGRLYYRLGLDYIPMDLQLEPRERGFTVLRTYAGVDDPGDVWQDPDGTWHMKLGARIRIDVTLVAPGQRHHVLLASPLPAGLELVNPALVGSRSFPSPNTRSWYYGYWFDQQQLLDERALAVTTWLPGGVYRYGVVAEATTAGTFQVPPARASEIYTPETFGYSASEVVVVTAE